MAISAFTRLSGRSLNPTGVLFLNAYFPKVTPSEEITSVAKFFSGFSKFFKLWGAHQKHPKMLIETPVKKL